MKKLSLAILLLCAVGCSERDRTLTRDTTLEDTPHTITVRSCDGTVQTFNAKYQPIFHEGQWTFVDSEDGKKKEISGGTVISEPAN